MTYNRFPFSPVVDTLTIAAIIDDNAARLDAAAFDRGICYDSYDLRHEARTRSEHARRQIDEATAHLRIKALAAAESDR